jgi:hypothetical protein
MIGMTLSHTRGKRTVKAFSPPSRELALSPRRLRQKATERGYRRLNRNRAEQPRQRAFASAQQQPQQHGHKVLVLRTAEAVRECLGLLAQPFVYAYNRDSHRVSPRLRVSVASPLYRRVRDAPTQKLKVQRY